MSSNPAHGEVHSIQNYVMKFVNDLRACQWFSLGTPVFSPNDDITEIVLKMALNTITLTLNSAGKKFHQYQQNKESLNSDGQQFHQYQQNKQGKFKQ